ncbi:epsilon-lactone hydrolase [Microdochium nivale]|nr:epsilon-lactone hydrolase [Microdochium nivale]
MTGPGAAAATTDRRDNSPTIVETRDELSSLYRALRTAIRPLRPRLVAPPKKPMPRGSPQLSHDARITRTSACGVTERQDEFGLGLWVYDFEPKGWGDDSTGTSTTKTTKTTTTTHHHRVLFFAGGGFRAPPSSFHWRLVAQMAREMADTHRFTLVSYPLAPANTAADSLPLLREYLRRLVAATAAADDYDDATASGSVGLGRQRRRISLMGDSSGGNIALSLGMWWATQLGGTGMPIDTDVDTPPTPGLLRAVYAISPVVDMRDTNPDIDAADKLDPLLTKVLTEEVAAAWSGTPTSPATAATTPTTAMATAALARDDPSISPVCHDAAVFVNLAAQGIRVHGIIGTDDCLAPDALLFQQKCVKQGVPGRWLVWKGQMHCFVLAGVGA